MSIFIFFKLADHLPGSGLLVHFSHWIHLQQNPRKKHALGMPLTRTDLLNGYPTGLDQDLG